MVEKWLIQVEEVMIMSLKKVTCEAFDAYAEVPREDWVQEWPGQVCLRSNSFRFYVFSSLTKTGTLIFKEFVKNKDLLRK